MLLKSELDIHSVVYSHTYTPSLQAKKLPFFLECTGRYVYGKEYYTEREGVNTYLLLFTIRGQGEIATPTQRFSVPAGCAALMDGNTGIATTARASCGKWPGFIFAAAAFPPTSPICSTPGSRPSTLRIRGNGWAI